MALIDSLSESIIALLLTNDLEFSLHTADPGKTGANEADITVTNGRPEVLSTDWAAAVADGVTGGRLRDNIAEILFGNGTAAETVTHIGVWLSGGAFQMGRAIGTPRTLVVGEPVKIAIGGLDVVGGPIS